MVILCRQRRESFIGDFIGDLVAGCGVLISTKVLGFEVFNYFGILSLFKVGHSVSFFGTD